MIGGHYSRRMQFRIKTANNDESPLKWLALDASIMSSRLVNLQSM